LHCTHIVWDECVHPAVGRSACVEVLSSVSRSPGRCIEGL